MISLTKTTLISISSESRAALRGKPLSGSLLGVKLLRKIEPSSKPATGNPILGLSLTSRRSVYSRNGVAWLAARAWRESTKRADIRQLKAVKLRVDPAFVAAASADVCSSVRAFFGQLHNWTVSTVAVGHSRRPDSFAVQVAEAAAQELGLPFAKVFADRFVQGVSHPKEFSKLPPLVRVVDPVQPVLLVDDIATSGWHLEEAARNLRASSIPCFAITWISGTVK